MIKHVRFDSKKWGKGFITHSDWVKLHFSVQNNLAIVTGEEADIDAWMLRVEGAEISQKDADFDRAVWEKAGLEAEQVELSAKITVNTARISVLATAMEKQRR